MSSSQFTSPQSYINCTEIIRKMLEDLTCLRKNVETFVTIAIGDGTSDDYEHVMNNCSNCLNSIFVDLDGIQQGFNQLPTERIPIHESVLGLLLYSSEDSEVYDDALDACKWQTRAREATNIIDEVFRRERAAVIQTDPQYDINDLRRFGRGNSDCDAAVTTEIMNLLENVAGALVSADRTDGMQLVARRKGDCFIEMTVGFPSLTVDALIRGYLVETVKVRLTDNRRFPNRACKELCRQLERTIRGAAWHFADLFPPEQSTKSFLLWLRKQITFPSSRCLACGQTIRDGMPPLWRDSINSEPYHYDCRFDRVEVAYQ